MNTDKVFDEIDNLFLDISIEAIYKYSKQNNFLLVSKEISGRFEIEGKSKFIDLFLTDFQKLKNIEKYKFLNSAFENLNIKNPKKRESELMAKLETRIKFKKWEKGLLPKDSIYSNNHRIRLMEQPSMIFKITLNEFTKFYKLIHELLNDINDKFSVGLLSDYENEVRTKKTLTDLSEQLVIIELLQNVRLFPIQSNLTTKKDYYKFLSGLLGEKDFKGKQSMVNKILAEKKPTPAQAKNYIFRLQNVEKYFEYISKDNQPIQIIVEKIKERIFNLQRFSE